MSNAQDLLSILNGRRAASAPSNAAPTPKSILTFKAGKMNTALRPNGKYTVAPDARRGELHLLLDNNGNNDSAGLKIEWKDRRTKATVDTVHVANPQDATFERVETPNESDRVYLLTVDANANNDANDNADGRHFFWMQDRSDEMDEEICVKFNLYLSDVDEAKKAAGVTTTGGANANAGGSGDGVNASAGDAASNDNNNGAMDNDQLLRIMQGALGGEQGRAMTGE